MSWLDDLLQKVVQVGTTVFPSRKIIRLVAGAGVTIDGVDNATASAVEITIAAPGGGPTLPVVVPLASKSADYSINPATDERVSFTTGGHTCKLPGATLSRTPGNGESYEVHTVPGGVTTLDGDGFNFEATGNTTYVQSAGETTTVRFNATTSQWEIS